MASPAHRRRFSRDNWIDLGLAQAARESPEAMTLEAVCRAAGRTRGSFYHHFPAHTDFLEAVAARWLDRDTDAVIAQVPAGGELGDLLRQLNRLTAQLDTRLERGMRQLAAAYPVLSRTVALADSRRKAYIRSLYQASGMADVDLADRLATLIYAAYVGFAFVEPGASAARREALFELLPPGPAVPVGSDTRL